MEKLKEYNKKIVLTNIKTIFYFYFFILPFISVFLANIAGITTAYITLTKIDKLIYSPSIIAPKKALSIALTTKNSMNTHPYVSLFIFIKKSYVYININCPIKNDKNE